MTVTVTYFGLLIDVTQRQEEQFELPFEHHTLVDLVKVLEAKYPILKNTTYRMALNQSFCPMEASITSEDRIVLLPPFAGG